MERSVTFTFPSRGANIRRSAFIETAMEENKEGSNLQMVVLHKESKDLLGCSGLHHIDRKTPELGIWIKKSAHGNAYGKEAMIALKKWGDQNVDYEYILYPVSDKNYASKKILEFLGGKIAREYDEKNMSGEMQHLLEYRIYLNRNEDWRQALSQKQSLSPISKRYKM